MVAGIISSPPDPLNLIANSTLPLPLPDSEVPLLEPEAAPLPMIATLVVPELLDLMAIAIASQPSPAHTQPLRMLIQNINGLSSVKLVVVTGWQMGQLFLLSLQPRLR